MKYDYRRRMLMSLGILLVISPFIIKRFNAISDGLSGYFVGLGIGLMIVALLRNKIKGVFGNNC